MATFDKSQYDQEYNRQYVIVKRLPFNRRQTEDMALLAWAESHGNFTAYMKDLIRQDMGKQDAPKPDPDPESRG